MIIYHFIHVLLVVLLFCLAFKFQKIFQYGKKNYKRGFFIIFIEIVLIIPLCRMNMDLPYSITKKYPTEKGEVNILLDDKNIMYSKVKINEREFFVLGKTKEDLSLIDINSVYTIKFLPNTSICVSIENNN